MKQIDIFGNIDEQAGDERYTQKIELPTYEPNRAKPHVKELYDDSKTKRLIAKINASEIPEDEKQFLRIAAQRHTVFHFEKAADYYAHSSKEVQELFEQQALVIIDFNKAFEQGYIRLAHKMANQYFDIYGDDEKGA